MSITSYERSWKHDDREAFVEGPWTTEPDKMHWIDEATDLDCLLVRNRMGAWCGYVGVPPGHPFHGVGYDECTAKDCDKEWCYKHTPEAIIEVHGGLTFASSCHESAQGEGYGICHAPLPGRPHDVWWLGFDCAHAGDLSPWDLTNATERGFQYPFLDPRLDHYGPGTADVYRDVQYVKAETARLAAQVKSART